MYQNSNKEVNIMVIDTKTVEFAKYCSKCKHNDIEEYEDPCDECLSNSTNVNSRRPVMFEGL